VDWLERATPDELEWFFSRAERDVPDIRARLQQHLLGRSDEATAEWLGRATPDELAWFSRETGHSIPDLRGWLQQYREGR
jgi:hypothetical protein